MGVMLRTYSIDPADGPWSESPRVIRRTLLRHHGVSPREAFQVMQDAACELNAARTALGPRKTNHCSAILRDLESRSRNATMAAIAMLAEYAAYRFWSPEPIRLWPPALRQIEDDWGMTLYKAKRILDSSWKMLHEPQPSETELWRAGCVLASVALTALREELDISR
jgi:hypothetical protein